MDKKTMIRWLLSIFLFVLLFFSSVHLRVMNPIDGHVETGSYEKQFKEEYESLNGIERDGKGYKNIEVTIDENNRVVYASQEGILEILDKGTGIIYFGFPDCPWCRNLVPILIRTAKEEGVKQIYYYNAKEDRDEKKLADGKIEEVKKGSDFYLKLLEKLGDKASKYDGLSDDSIKRLYFPTVLFVKGGKIVSMHEGTVPSQLDPLQKLTEKQEKELEEIFIDGINAVYGETCDDKC